MLKNLLFLSSALVIAIATPAVEPYGMWPDQTITIDARIGIGDLSVVFWEAAQRPIEVRLHRPEADTLQIELLPSGAVNDSAVHIVNDGRVMIY